MYNVQVLEVAAGELIVGNDLDLAVTLLGDLDGVAKVADAALDLDPLVQELLEGGDVEDLVARGLRGIDDELITPARQSGPGLLGRRFGIGDSTHLPGNLGGLALLLKCEVNDLAYCFTPWSLRQKKFLAEGLGQQQSGIIYIL